MTGGGVSAWACVCLCALLLLPSTSVARPLFRAVSYTGGPGGSIPSSVAATGELVFPEDQEVMFQSEHRVVDNSMPLTALGLQSVLGGVNVLVSMEDPAVSQVLETSNEEGKLGFVDLSGLFADPEWDLANSLSPVILEHLLSPDGRPRRLPFTGTANKLMCNRARLEDAGWDPSQYTAFGMDIVPTLEDLMRLETVARRNAGTQLPQICLGSGPLASPLMLLVHMEGPEYARKVLRGEVSFQEPEIRAWLEVIFALRPHAMVHQLIPSSRLTISGAIMCTYVPAAMFNLLKVDVLGDDYVVGSIPPPAASFRKRRKREHARQQGTRQQRQDDDSPWPALKVPVSATIVYAEGIKDPWRGGNDEDVVKYFREFLRREYASVSAFPANATIAEFGRGAPVVVPVQKLEQLLPAGLSAIIATARALTDATDVFGPMATTGPAGLTSTIIALEKQLFPDAMEGGYAAFTVGDPFPELSLDNVTETLELQRVIGVLIRTPSPTIKVNYVDEERSEARVEILPAGLYKDIVIRYTLDGTMPDEASPLYSRPISIATDGETIVRATADHEGLRISLEVSAVVNINNPNGGGGSSLGAGFIVGIVLAVVALLASLAAAVWAVHKWVRSRRRRIETERQAQLDRDASARKLEAMVQSLQSEVEERRALEAKLLNESRVKSQFIANMSHELRTPIHGVQLGASLLGLSRLDAEQKAITRTMDASATLLLSIVNDIIDVSMLEEDKFKVSAAPFNIVDIVDTCLQMLSARATEANIALSCFFKPGCPRTVITDGDRLRQCVLNLVANAIKFSSGRSVAVVVRFVPSVLTGAELPPPPGVNPKGTLVLEVRDSGAGITRDAVSRLFQRFSQVDGSHARSHGGSGLGLFITREISRRLGGWVSVASVRGVGTTFSLAVPVGTLQSGGSKARSEAVLESMPRLVEDADVDDDDAGVGHHGGNATAMPTAKRRKEEETRPTVSFDVASAGDVVVNVDGNAAAGTAAAGAEQLARRVPPLELTPARGKRERAKKKLPIAVVAVRDLTVRGIVSSFLMEELPLSDVVFALLPGHPAGPPQLQVIDPPPAVAVIGADAARGDAQALSFGMWPFYLSESQAITPSDAETADDAEEEEEEETNRPNRASTTGAGVAASVRGTCLIADVCPILHRNAAPGGSGSGSTLAEAVRNAARGREVALAIVDMEAATTAGHEELVSLRGSSECPAARVIVLRSLWGGKKNQVGGVNLSNANVNIGYDTPSETGTSAGHTIQISPAGAPELFLPISRPDLSTVCTTALHMWNAGVIGNPAGISTMDGPQPAVRSSTTGEMLTLRESEKPREKSPHPGEGGAAKGSGGAKNGEAKLEVLLAEDNPVNAKLMVKLLSRLGAHVSHAIDGSVACVLHKSMAETPKKVFDVILMDLQMPVVTGWEATSKIRALEEAGEVPRTTIIALSAAALDKDDAKNEEFDGFEMKPVSLQRVKDLLQRIKSNRK